MAFGGPSKQSKKQNPVQPSDHSGNVVEERPSKSENAEWVERDEQVKIKKYKLNLINVTVCHSVLQSLMFT